MDALKKDDYKLNYLKLLKHRAARAAPNRNSSAPFPPDGTSRHWNEMSDSLQIGYLEGFLEGLKLGALHGVVECVVESCRASAPTPGLSKVKRIVGQYAVPGLTLNELRKGVTTIYKSPKNSSIGVSGALKAFVMKLKCKPKSDIDDYLNIARQGVITQPDSDKPDR